MLQPVAVAPKSLADYTHIVGRDLVDEIRELAEPLRGRRVVHLSATAYGGGVGLVLAAPYRRDASYSDNSLAKLQAVVAEAIGSIRGGESIAEPLRRSQA